MAIGPGLGTSEATGEVILNILENYEGTAVIDADALTALSRKAEILPQLKCSKILTPHPGEMARLCGLNAAEVDVRRIELAEKYAAEWNCVLVLKGAPTVIGCPDDRYACHGNRRLRRCAYGHYCRAVRTGH